MFSCFSFSKMNAINKVRQKGGILGDGEKESESKTRAAEKIKERVEKSLSSETEGGVGRFNFCLL